MTRDTPLKDSSMSPDIKDFLKLYELQNESIQLFSRAFIPNYKKMLMDKGLIDENNRVICGSLDKVACELADTGIAVTKEILTQFNQPYGAKAIENAVTLANRAKDLRN